MAITREQAMDVLDALADDVDDYKRRCLLGPFAGGPILRSDFERCSNSTLVGVIEHFLDVEAPKLLLAQRYEQLVRAASVASAQARSEFERMGSEQSAGALADRFLHEVVTPTVEAAVKGGIGVAGLALAAYALWRLSR
jgi:hypothetical protein